MEIYSQHQPVHFPSNRFQTKTFKENLNNFNIPFFRRFYYLDSPYKKTKVSAIPKTDSNKILQLPKSIHIIIISFLEHSEIIYIIQLINHYFSQLVKEPFLWNFLNKILILKIPFKYHVTQKRTKNHIFEVCSRIDNCKALLKRVDLRAINSGLNDGVPSSLLREISIMTYLDSALLVK